MRQRWNKCRETQLREILYDYFCKNKREEVKRSIVDKKYIRPSLQELNRLFRETVKNASPNFSH